jgi:cullin-4
MTHLLQKPRVEEVVEIRDDSSQAVDTHFSQSMSTPPAFSNNDLGQSPVEGKNGLSTSAPARPQVNGARRAGHTSSAGATVGGSLNSSGGPKKLVIKGFEKKPTLPADFEEERWRRLQGAVQAVYASRPVPASLEELYKAAEDLCSHRMAANLYRRLVGEMEEHIKSELGRLMERMASTSDALSFLTFLNAMWQDHCQHTLVIRSVFLYLDRTYVIQTPGIRSIWFVFFCFFFFFAFRFSETTVSL